MFFKVLPKSPLPIFFGTFVIEINFIVFKLNVKMKLSFQEYVLDIQNLLILTSEKGSNSPNAYFATVH